MLRCVTRVLMLTLAVSCAQSTNGVETRIDPDSGEEYEVATGAATMDGEFAFGDVAGPATVEMVLSEARRVDQGGPSGESDSEVYTGPTLFITVVSADLSENWGKLKLELNKDQREVSEDPLDPTRLTDFADWLAEPMIYEGPDFFVSATIRGSMGSAESRDELAEALFITTSEVGDNTMRWSIRGEFEDSHITTTFQVRNRFDEDFFVVTD